MLENLLENKNLFNGIKCVEYIIAATIIQVFGYVESIMGCIVTGLIWILFDLMFLNNSFKRGVLFTLARFVQIAIIAAAISAYAYNTCYALYINLPFAIILCAATWYVNVTQDREESKCEKA